MYLKSLTLKGFKSFASSTTLRFESGITCVVGPNGSGKSNVVDAIAWVLGEQGAKALRGGKMEDVIFAGTTGRAPLGRAEVTLSIDNADGAIPIEYSEVSITRRMFRSGESEYEINGDRCRLLDIQELLSDSGIGREMHVLVGQGKLDSYLHARPEDRRAFIEEAAGVLKHRKRKEKALRKLDGMQANLDRLNDLTAELRRQLKPLGKQAELARRAASIQAELREARLRLLSDDLTTLRSNIAQELADEADMQRRRAELETENEQLSAQIAELESDLAEGKPRLNRLQETWYRLQAVAERLRSTLQIAQERHRFLTEDADQTRPGRDPDQLEAEAERIREQEVDIREALVEDQERLSNAVEARENTEETLAEAEQLVVTAVKQAADRREHLAKLRGRVDSLTSRSAAAEEELERATTALVEAEERAESANAAYAQAQEASAGSDQETEQDRALAHAEDELASQQEMATQLSDAERGAEREVTQWQAREEALSVGLQRKDGAAALLGQTEAVPGLRGSLAALLTVKSGYEPVIASALGSLADAVAVTDVESATAALRQLHTEEAGQAGFLIGASVSAPVVEIPAGVLPVSDLVSAPSEIASSVATVLAGMVLAEDLTEASALIQQHPQLTAVTREGDVVAAHQAAGGSDSQQSYIEVQAAVDEAREQRRVAENRRQTLATQLADAKQAVVEADERREVAREVKQAQLRELSEADKHIAELGAAAKSATAEVERLHAAQKRAQGAIQEDSQGLVQLQAELETLEAEPESEEPSTEERDLLVNQLQAERQNEMETRLAVRTAEERVSALAGRADGLLRQAQAERAERARAQARQEARERGAHLSHLVAKAATTTLERVEASLQETGELRDAAAAEQSSREAALTGVRERAKTAATELDRITNAAHREELARAEQRLRIEQLEEKAAEDFGVDIDTLLSEYGPDQPMAPTAAEIAKAEEKDQETPGEKPFDRAAMEKRAARGERELKLLGKVNPLALEEFAALEERYKFLSEQLDDVKRTRADLLHVIKEVDERIQIVFEEAFADTAREFEDVFATVFPGGEGRLVLTQPDDMLNTGIEVEARPPGKKVKRLSLLSGGERSLTAVALLCAIFRARPSPFYLMDEVEAALDDVNLQRLLSLLTQLRENSQLLVITHQKRTMEVADALYGVTMRGGVTQVISQKLTTEDA